MATSLNYACRSPLIQMAKNRLKYVGNINIQACVGVKEALSAGTLYNDTCKHYTVSSNKKGSFRHLLINNGQLDFRIDRVDDVQTRLYSSPPRRKGFISGVLENIKEEISKNKEMKDNIKKFREEAEKLEQSDALKKARRKYERMESETSKNSEVLKQRLDEIKSKLSETIEQAQKTEIAKRSKEISEEIGRSAREAAEVVGKSGKRLGDSAAFKSISEGVKAVKEEIDESKLTHSQVYRAPQKLRLRVDSSLSSDTQRPIKPNEDATGVELHKDSKWFQSWENFKDNNAYVNKLFDLKVKYDESDNPVVRASRLLTDKVTDLFGGVFQKTELSEVLTEIVKMDPSFDKESFLKKVEFEIIPNILEAMIRGDLEILKDWCHEAPYNALATPIKQAKSMGYKFDSKILDVGNVDLAMGKMMDQGPVLIVSFQSQQILVVRNASGTVVEGDPNKILRMHYVWVLCRDQTVLDPDAAWKLMDLSANSAEQWL